ncbi:MAG: hypothetical protein CM15mP104_0080 [Gammaproteobacteria bacterium]|nr:MAG: hypothetical protein CM15mP104_0080 [Gammaproteobacteria bacterium]
MEQNPDKTRRKVLISMTASVGAVGAAFAVTPLLHLGIQVLKPKRWVLQ